MVSKSSCPAGTIERRGYTAHRYGKTIQVKPTCIRATSISGKKRSVIDREKLAAREKIHEEMAKKYGTTRCPPGEIERAGYTRHGYKRRAYTRRSGSHVHGTEVGPTEVAPVCIRDIGTKGHGYKIPTVLTKGVLKKYGYEDVRNLPVNKRHAILKKVVKDTKNPLSLFRKINILATMNKNRDPELSKIFKNDAYWVEDTFGTLRHGPYAIKSPGMRTRAFRTKRKGGSKTSRKKL